MKRIIHASVKIGLILALINFMSCENMLGEMAGNLRSIQQEFLAFMNRPEPEISVEYHTTIYTIGSDNPTITMPAPQKTGVGNNSQSAITLIIHNISNAAVTITDIDKSGNCADSFDVNPEHPSVDLHECSLANPPVCGETSFDITFTANDNNSGYNQVNISIQTEDENGNSYAPFRLSVECLNPKETLIPKIDVYETSNLSIAITSTDSFSFSNQPLFTQSPGKTFRISNNGTGNLIISGISLDDEINFKYLGIKTFSLSAQQYADITIYFTPQCKGSQNLVLNINNNATPNPFVINFSGTSIQPSISINPYDTNITFDPQIINTMSPGKTFTITNIGTYELNITAMLLSDTLNYGCDTQNGFTLQPNDTRNFILYYNPKTISNPTHTATLTIKSDDYDNPNYILNLTGTSTKSAIVVKDPTDENMTNGDTYDFGGCFLDEPPSANFKIQNNGTGDLIITSIDLNDPANPDFYTYTYTNIPNPPTVNPGNYITLTVKFQPNNPDGKIHNAAIIIKSNDPDNETVFLIFTGFGVGHV
jgi:hypothetical protein